MIILFIVPAKVSIYISIRNEIQLDKNGAELTNRDSKHSVHSIDHIKNLLSYEVGYMHTHLSSTAIMYLFSGTA